MNIYINSCRKQIQGLFTRFASLTRFASSNRDLRGETKPATNEVWWKQSSVGLPRFARNDGNTKGVRAFVVAALLLFGGTASAQVVINGNVYGGGLQGQYKSGSTNAGNTTVTINNGTVEGSVYGGGEGLETDETAGLVEGNATVTMTGGTVERSIYGGGQLGNVGTYTETYTAPSGAHVLGEPKVCKTGTGLATVTMSGGSVGKQGSLMPNTSAQPDPDDDDRGWIFCGGRGEVDSITYPKANLLGIVGSTYLEISGGVITASAYGGSENGLTLGNTHVKITGGQIGTGLISKTTANPPVGTFAPVYTQDKWDAAIAAVQGGDPTTINAIAAQFYECDAFPYGIDDDNDPATPKVYYVYDIYANQYTSNGGSLQGSNGHSFFGNVFGGGSGYYPIKAGVWRRSAGRVWGNTLVEIEGGHILTAVYGGNEITDVMGKCTVEMSGGTLGVPRTLTQIRNHPVTCGLYGGSMGDPRSQFNQWCTVNATEVTVTGGTIFGSVFGGGEDGHVLNNATVTIDETSGSGDAPLIGTWGYSRADGNVFGGGRGFSGLTIPAGAVCGNVEVNIHHGTILGSIYGGGRLASAGIGLSGTLDPTIGYFIDDIPDDPNTPEDESETHGHVTINIKGGTIGNDYESKLHLGNPELTRGRTYGGNVFGGSMGSLYQLDGTTINTLWPVLGQVKETTVNIEGDNTIIKGSVFGGGETGLVLDNTNVNVSGGTIWRNVYGGGYGSDDYTTTTDVQTGVSGVTFRYTPMAFAGVVSKTTNVKISGGWVKKNVYGGGEMASVGLIDYQLNSEGTDFKNITKHTDVTSSFALSWPYDYQYFTGFVGQTNVEITGGRIGITGKDYMGPWNASGLPIYYDNSGTAYVYNLTDGEGNERDKLKEAREDNGDVYGGGHGIAGDRYNYAFCANTDKTVVNIKYPDSNDATPENYRPTNEIWTGESWVYTFLPKASSWTTYGTRGCITGGLYGGGENGHVLTSTNVTLGDATDATKKGLIGHNLYGGGKGSDTYKGTLKHIEDHPSGTWHQGDEYTTDVPSITAGKVYGSTTINIYNGNVVRNVYGGGNQASVGKGNYGGGPTVYPYVGYGEAWTDANATELKGYLANSGHTYVNIYGGTIGTVKGMKDDLPTGNVFGGCRGTAAPNVALTPRIEYSPEFFLGYVNHTHVKIGQSVGTHTTPRLYGCVFGGGQDGHVRWQTDVVVNDGKIGNEYVNREAALDLVGTNNLDDYQWLGRGSVYGAGMGLGKYKDVNGDEHYSPSAGSVTQLTNVTINGGTIHNEVYGGGPLATVGPPNMGQTTDAPLWNGTDGTLSKVTINSTVGVSTDVIGGTYEEGGVTKTYSYGGNVYGASRGLKSFMAASTFDEADFAKYATTVYTQVDLNTGAIVPGYVYGGGFLGQVKQNTDVNMIGGTVGTIDYTDANNDGTFDGVTHTSGGSVFGGGHGVLNKIDAARVKGNTDVTISGGHVLFNVYGGGETASVGLNESYTYDYNSTTFTDLRPKKNAANQDTGVTYVTISGGQVGPAPRIESGYNIPCGLSGTDGYVFGGGKGVSEDNITDPTHPYSGSYYNIADVNYTSVTVDMPMYNGTTNLGRIWGSVFGGAEDGHVLGNAHTEYVSGLMGTQGTTSYDGNIFGGGRNYSKANYNAGRVRGNISVLMCGGQIYGSIFGGGRLALTGVDQYGNIIPDGAEEGAKYGNTYVKVNGGTIGNDNIVHDATLGDVPFINTFTTFPMGDVFGGGKGDKVGITGHPKASALLVSLVKNTEVLVTDSIKDGSIVSTPKVLGSVFGGGEVATVGQFTWTLGTGTISNIAMVDGTGVAKVTVSGGQIGVDRMKMDYTLADGAGNYNLKYNTDLGHVFGGGEGRSEDPTADGAADIDCIINGVHHSKYLLDLLATVGETDVTITNSVTGSGEEIGSAWVKGSVYGGAMSGHVMRDTKVTVSGGVVGAGKGTSADLKYTADDEPGKLFNPLTATDAYDATTGDVLESYALAECEAWPYDSTTCRPFDALQLKANSSYTPSDGKTWFGNVFGGGSGYYPYYKETSSGSGTYQAFWNRDAGKVYGNATVIITGGHILTSVFGGGEINDVGHFTYDPDDGGTFVGLGTEHTGGVVSVTMSGGTLGVPRTFDQIKKHPVTCYLFGAGKGNPTVDFNTYTNVKQATAIVNGGIIYGSVFGGGEDGHVFENAIVTISETEPKTTVIGTTGRSTVDGNVFGGGRGFTGEALTAGVVRGNVTMSISGGTMLGSVFGGGRLAAVGTHLVPSGNANYGKLVTNSGSERHGYITVNISGGTIGNTFEGETVPHTIGGNVYGGGMGRIKNLDGTTVNTQWPQMALAKHTKVNISGSTTNIKGDVYGGGKLGTVAKHGSDQYAGNSHVIVSGGSIGRNVYGGGYGSMELGDNVTINGVTYIPVGHAGYVFGNDTVNISGTATIGRNVYGGGEMASVGTYTVTSNSVTCTAGTGDTYITVSGGTIGNEDDYDTYDPDDPLTQTKGGNVFGGGKGLIPASSWSSYLVYANVNNTTIETSGTPTIYGSIYGGAALSHVLGNTTLTIAGGNIGTHGITSWDGNIFGGGMGLNQSNTAGRVAGNTSITMTAGHIQGSVYGGGRLGITGINHEGHFISASQGKATVSVSGTVTGTAPDLEYSTTLGNENPVTLLASDFSVGDIFGGGRGDVDNYQNVEAGRVTNTEVTVSGNPIIRGSVFGGGEMASVGYLNGSNEFIANTGESTVTISGGTIGSAQELTYNKPGSATNPNPGQWTMYDADGKIFHTCTGNVFGGCQGDVDFENWSTQPNNWPYMGRSKTATVTINDGATIISTVFGGSEQGTMDGNTNVTINGGTIGSLVNPGANQYYVGGVYGAGYGSDDPNENDHEVIVNGVTTTAKMVAGRVYGSTRADVLGGTINGDVYGGASFAYVGTDENATTSTTKLYIGNADQLGADNNVGTTILGSVYGANNRSGTPLGNVEVHVYHTAHTTANQAPATPTPDPPGWTPEKLLENALTQQYALKEVFGGGNRASFIPNQAPSRTTVPRSTTVHVYACENTIRDLYGGSNAADIGSNSVGADCNVIVDGGRFYRIFGGGNGTETFANVYGTATTRINAGVIQEVYGGGNHNGIIDNIDLEITHANAANCDDFIYNVFGGNNEAEVIGDIVSVINCGDGSQYEFYGGNNTATVYGNVITHVFGGETAYLFGGSKGIADDPTTPVDESRPAHIRQFPSYQEIKDDIAAHPTDPQNRKYSATLLEYMGFDPDDETTFKTELVHTKGNVTLNIFGGKISGAAFGGSDVNGTIDGKITVNVFDTEISCALDLNDLYGAGRNTSYDPIYPETGTERISPVVNVIHGTVKGNIFGGGMGASATTSASSEVNIGYYDALGIPTHAGDYMKMLYDTIHNYVDDPSISYVWPGPEVSAYTALAKKDVYGGGQLAAVTGNTYLNMFRGTVGTDGTSGTDGNLFGGGQGQAGSLTTGRVGGNTTVEMRNGTVLGNIYGGGRLALTGVNASGVMQDGTDHGNTYVYIKGGTVGNSTEIETFTTFSMGNIYGGGKGFLENSTGTHSAEAILLSGLTKNTTVEISDLLSNNTHVYGIVLGGGELASVGNYTLTKDGSDNITNIAVTEGKATVRIGGGTIGGDRALMRPDTEATGSPWLLYNDDLGYVYGGGEGWSDNPYNYPLIQEGPTANDTIRLVDLIATVQSTEVEISGTAWVKASVFGGSESGHVRGNTKVTISGGTIGAGNNTTDNKDEYYDDDDFNNPTLNSLYGTAHWPYASPYTPFDPALLSQGITPKDGRSWFGNVFGGGSGWFPYVTGDGTTGNPYQSHWNPLSGKVWGNTEVNITGGHILNNVYGANESTDVGGTATVKISGGTIGVPRDAAQIALHPTSSNVFGGGAGDPRAIFDGITNVASTDVQITGGTIYGSVFGGAEEGHVLGNAEVSINQADGTTVIGSTGFSAYDGHVFGGGKGKVNKELGNTWNFACGRVAGNTHVTMSAGTALGNLYGGGFVALTGVDENGSFASYMLTTPEVYFDSINHGKTQVDLTGGTIGNNANSGLDLLRSTQKSGNVYGGGRGSVNEFREDDLGRATKAVVNISNSPTIYGSVFGGGQMANVGYWIGYETGWYAKGTGLTEVNITGSPTIGTAKEFDSDYAAGTPSPTNTEYETVNGLRRISHTLTGNVYGGGQGNAKADVNGFAVGTEQGHSRSTRVSISGTGSPTIMSCVFGGAEQGAVWGDTKVTISRGNIGKTGVVSHRWDDVNNQWVAEGTYSFGSVFGGSRGEDGYRFTTANANAIDSITRLAGRVYFNTYVGITGGTVYGNVFGGGDLASVGYWIDKKDEYDNLIDFVPAQYPNTTVGIKGKATVNISGTAKIGPMDGTGLNAYVYGGGKGIGEDPIPYRYNKYCNINSTEVTVNLTYSTPNDANPETGWNSSTDGRIYGSVYGGGSDCHVLGNTKVILNGGIVGTYVPGTGSDPGTITDYGGNIFGGGRNFLKKNYAPGRVAGNPEVEMNGGYIYGAIFGGGRHATVGTGIDGMTMRANDATTGDHGKTTVKVKGGTVGYKPLVSTFTSRPIGEVYGAGKGTMVGITGHPAASPLLIALVKNTEVEISQTSSSVPTRILNSVYGGGEVGNVGHYSWTVNSGTGNIEDIQLISDGQTVVTVKGGTIGLDRMEMSYQLVGGSDPATRYNPATNPTGNVFGGGKGLSVDPTTYAGGIDCIIDGRDYSKYLLDLMATVGSTTVTVEDQSTTVKPWVKSSVYGGSACGHVMGNTVVNITGGQIGAGDSSTADIDPYGDDQFVDASTTTINDGNALKPTFHWVYGIDDGSGNMVYNPFDLVAIYNGISGSGNYPVDYTYKPSDGKTWFGNVFGGGSGFLPYVKETSSGVYECIWNRESGKVYGNSTVTITGGHILSCVYGGCETADVGLYQTNSTIHGEEWLSGGTATVVMQGGTVGVPRTNAQITAHPIPGYVYGSGKGDPRSQFNTWTNVNKTNITLTGGKIYGCLFGGGEDGHVMGNVTMSVSETNGTNNPTVIGCSGTTRADGNVFGAGRGTTAEALTAGSVGGNVTLNVLGGKVLANVYGGGNRGSVGTYLVDEFLPDGTTPNSNYYGKMREDDGSHTYGYTTVTISGGRIGNNNESPSQANPTTIGGNVFGGGRGIFSDAPGSIWPSAARVKQTEVYIQSSAVVKASVYGGGQIGSVRNNATVYIQGGTIGTAYGTTPGTDLFHYGSVFGGGQGYENLSAVNDSTKAAVYLAGRVYGNTTVNLSGGQVFENVFGGGEIASVGWVKDDGTMVNGASSVNMTGGQVGPLDMTGLNGYVYGGPEGGGQGSVYRPYANSNTSSVEVNMDQDDGTHKNRVWGSLFGGGSDGHVLDDASVTLTNGTVGTDGTTGYDGNIFGAGRNYHESSLTAGRVQGNVTVTMNGGELTGSIFGGGRQGLTGVDMIGEPIADKGHITVTVTAGTVGNQAQMGSSLYSIGDVFGGGKGQPNSTATSFEHNRLGEVRSTAVTIGGTATVNGSVYGGSENGWVLENTSATIAGSATIGYNPNEYRGNVFGGGRGADTDQNPSNSGNYCPQFGRVNGIARVNVNGGTITRHVFGGGSSGIVVGARIVNIDEAESTEPTTINGSVFGGSNVIPDEDGTTTPPTLYTGHGNLKTVNVRGGHILGSVYGCSYEANEGVATSWGANANWTAFVNITGGTIDQKVFGAGYKGEVNGSVSTQIGLTAVKEAPTYVVFGGTDQANNYRYDGLPGGTAPSAPSTKLKIGGNIYGGSDYYGVGGATNWNDFDIVGYSTMFIDGEGYDTEHDEEHSTNPYMNLAGGIYGSGNNTESGKKGREIILRKYGHRTMDGGEMKGATRSLTTIQRGGILLLDESNVHLSGTSDISQPLVPRKYGVMKMDSHMLVANASGIVLGADASPAFMDSIKEIRSVYLKEGMGTAYQQIGASALSNWELVGIKDDTGDLGLYRTVTSPTTPLAKDKENVILFNDDSRLYVRYTYIDGTGHEKTNYGPLLGFFRMKSPMPKIGMESFAYARPKLTPNVNRIETYNVETGNTWNAGDGGFLSYTAGNNDFITLPLTVLGWSYPDPYTGTSGDGGDAFTNSKQYPYYNIRQLVKSRANTDLDMHDYRVWLLPESTAHYWYVDGRGIGTATHGWGKDENHAVDNGSGVGQMSWGHYPDKPKVTISGSNGILNDKNSIPPVADFDVVNDVIFVVGPVEASKENGDLNNLPESLKLYRYPGGHKMSNGETDAGNGTAPTDPYTGLGSGVTAGPGANTGMMINANDNLVLNNVIVNGLYYDDFGSLASQLNIPSSFNTEKLNVNKPMVVTASGKTLTLKGGTTLTHGYNNTDAIGEVETGVLNYYANSSYSGSTLNGGALYVDPNATVNVEGLVRIADNWQRKGGTTSAPGYMLPSNVYLSTFASHLNISDALAYDASNTDNTTHIGITSPIKNTADSYVDNTFSPIAVANKTGATDEQNADIASAAWNHNNFTDDLNCFFVKKTDGGDERTTYYATSIPSYSSGTFVPAKTLYFGWTWANVQRTEPSGFADGSGNVTIDSEADMAWLISKVNELNGEPGATLSGKTVTQTIDLDMNQYVWVPVGTVADPFSGTFDGQGHLIKNLKIDYIGKGDGRFEYDDYGLFGYVNNGTVDRTFVVSGLIRPEGKVNMGGLVGRMVGTKALVSNSEAAVKVHCAVTTDEDYAAGGLVGWMSNGEIRSSMAMSEMVVSQSKAIGGMVGKTENGKVYNSFAIPKFTISDPDKVQIGGLVGVHGAGSVQNCYVNLQSSTSNNLTTSNYGQLVHTNRAEVKNSYGFKPYGDAPYNVEFPLVKVISGGSQTACYYYDRPAYSDTYGYLYLDNLLYQKSGDEWVKPANDTSMMVKLNQYVEAATPNGFGGEVDYARWYRPTIDGINGDLPVLLLSNFKNDDKKKPGLGGFRSMATYGGGPVLQYGGPDRDGNHLNAMLARMTTSDNVFVYGDVTDAAVAFGANQPAKIAIHEDVAILNPGALATYSNNYVGVTFDNSSRHATDVYGNTLHRDWHMFSTPLKEAPLGMDYTVESVNQNVNNDSFKWNPWDGTDELPTYGFTGDGYFPTQVPAGYSNPLDGYNYDMKKYLYPYDFYTWYEPRWQWINFKRNGPSHWHYDEQPGTTIHHHIEYQATPSAAANVNETNLVQGKGYMMAIHDNTYMQSHGQLNASNVTVALTNSTNKPGHDWTWVPGAFGYFGNNFVGNPFHAYLDFGDDTEGFGYENGFTSYYTYDADSAATNGKQCDYLIYPTGGSEGGYYAPRYLHPHQGFFLQTETDKDVLFKPGHAKGREVAGISPFRDGRPHYPLVNLFAYDSEGKGDVVIIEFNRPENGGGKKAKALRSGNHLIYAHNGDTDYGAFFAVEGTERVPVRFLSFESEQKPYTLRWDTHNGFFHSLYLIDNLLGITYDMLANDSYTFVGSKEDYASRFVIVFNVTDVEEKEDFNNFAFFNGSGSLVVNGTGRLEVIDVTGRILYTEDLHNEQNHVNLSRYAKGVYTLRLWNSDKARTQKIVMY